MSFLSPPPHTPAGIRNGSQLWQGLVLSPDGGKVAMEMLKSLRVQREIPRVEDDCRIPLNDNCFHG